MKKFKLKKHILYSQICAPVISRIYTSVYCETGMLNRYSGRLGMTHVDFNLIKSDIQNICKNEKKNKT